MRYGQRGGYTPAEQQRRERLRLGTAERFAAGRSTRQIAWELRVHERTVAKWRRAWKQGGAEALRSEGPVSREKLTPAQWTRVEAELRRGPLAHGFTGDQYWTLSRIRTLIGRMFIGYTIEGVWRLLRRHGWSCQVPSRRAVERDEEAIAVWKAEVWPQVKEPARHGRRSIVAAHPRCRPARGPASGRLGSHPAPHPGPGGRQVRGGLVPQR